MSDTSSIYREQVAYLTRQTPATIAVNGSVTLFTSAILWDATPDHWLLAWMMLQLCMIVLLYLQYRKNRNRSLPGSVHSPTSNKPRHNPLVPRAIIWGGAGGIPWGLTVIFLPHLPPIEQLALIIILFGMASGASSLLAAIPLAALSFILATLSPMIGYFFLQGTGSYAALGIMAVIYTLALLYATRTVYSSFLEASQNRRENAKLLQRIRTERSEAEASLLQSEKRYSDLVETVGDIIVSTELEGKFLFVNRAWYDRLGYDSDDLDKLTFRGTLHEDHLTQSIDHIRAVLIRESSAPVELVLKTKDGQAVWVEGNINPLIENGKIIRIQGIFRDISLRKQAERYQHEVQAQLQSRILEATRDLAATNTSLETQITVRRQAERAWRNSEAQLRLILDSTVEAIYGVDRDGRCTFANAACAHLLGYDDAAELLGADMHTITHTAQQTSREDCGICAVNKTQGSIQRDNEYFRHYDGHLFPVEYNAGSIVRDGQVAGGVVAFLDITRRRSAEDQLRQSQKMEAIGQLTGGIAHDFNNLLAIIIGNLDLLTSSLQQAAPASRNIMQKRTGAALRAAERAASQTQRLLSFSRKKTLNPQIISIGEILNEMNDLLPKTLGEEIKLDLQINAQDTKIFVDISQLENALLNLLINARDAMQGRGTLKGRVDLVKFDQPADFPRVQILAGEYVRFKVSDTGTGIAPEILDRVFEPFFTTKAEGLGTGLGLSMARGFVEQANGYICIESQLGHGTEVTIYLPVPTTDQITVAEISPQDLSELSGTATAADHTLILVVEDDPEVRNITVAHVQDLGYRVLSAVDGPNALEVFAANPDIDLIYTDIMMPNGMTGPILVQNIRKLLPNIKALYCTGYSEENNTLALDSSDIVLQKPVRKTLLAAKMKEVLAS